MKYLIPFLLSAFLFSSCATLIQGKKQAVRLNTNPEGATVYFNGQNTGKTTPCKIRIRRKIAPTDLNRRNEAVYSFSKNGYKTYQYRDLGRFNWLTVVDFMFVFPGFIDVSNGSHLIYSPELNIVLEPKTQKNTNTEITTAEPKNIPNKQLDYKYLAYSDVDNNIPVNGETYNYRFALIIGNEDYHKFQTSLEKEVNVDFARNDAHAFKAYAEKTLGIPEKNILFLQDATSAQMQEAIEKFSLLAKYAKGKAELIFYYAGHGLPDEETKEPYLIPVDVSGKNLQMAVNLKDIYAKLSRYKTKRTLVFLDACFSGGARNQGLIAARSIRVKPKSQKLQGNIIVFSASSENQTALPLHAEKHGLFTYFLLKEIKESKGKIKLKELSENVTEKVAIESLLRNSKEQKPEVSLSSEAFDEFENRKLND